MTNGNAVSAQSPDDSTAQAHNSTGSAPTPPMPMPPPPTQAHGLHHSSTGYQIEKLTGHENYSVWKFNMKNILIMDGLWKCVQGVDGDPSRDERALARICLSVTSTCYQYVQNATTCKEAWENLSKVFEDSGLSRKVMLLRKLHRIELQSFKSVSEYIQHTMMLVQQLADINKVIEDEEVAEILLSGLPLEYETLVTSLESVCVTSTLSSEVVRTRLLQEESRRADASLKNGTAFMSKSFVPANTATSRRCTYCGKNGHMKIYQFLRCTVKCINMGITIQALSALTPDDIKELIPQIGSRALFMRCWRTWKAEYTSVGNISVSNLDLLHFDITQDPGDLIIVPSEDQNIPPNSQTIGTHDLCLPKPQITDQTPLQVPDQTPQTGVLENLLLRSLETSSLLIYKGGTLDGDATRNLLASTVAREILNEHKNSPIVGQIYFKWANLIKHLFPGERTTTYYIPACTTASGANLQARGKLVHQVLNKRRRLQDLGALTLKRKRSREEISSAPTPSSHRPLPISLSDVDSTPNCDENLQWLRNSSDPWSLVETNWKITINNRIAQVHNENNSLESYLNEYPALKKPSGYALLHIDFEAAYGEQKDNFFVYFPMVKIKILDLLKKKNGKNNLNKKEKDNFTQELISLADSSNEDVKNLAALLAIPHLMTTATVKQQNKKVARSWKPSKVETRDAFIKHLKSDAEISQYIEQRINTLRNKGATSQPYVIIVGETLNEIKSCFVVLNKSVLYYRDNIVQTVDTCYKCIWALNVEYAIDSYSVWYFIQKGMYKMSSKYDRGCTAAESLLTDCKI